MRSWTDDEPGRGDVWPLHDSAAILARQVEHAADMTVLLRSAATGAESFWSGDGHDAWAASLQRSSGAWRGLHGFAQATRDAVTRYAESLESIKERAARIDGRIEKAEEGLALTSGGAGSFGPGQAEGSLGRVTRSSSQPSELLAGVTFSAAAAERLLRSEYFLGRARNSMPPEQG